MAELALVAASFLFTASLLATSGNGNMPAAVTIIFLPLALVIRGMAFQLFGVCERSFRHAGIADVDRDRKIGRNEQRAALSLLPNREGLAQGFFFRGICLSPTP